MKNRFFFTVIFAIVLIGCTPDQGAQSPNEDVEFTKLSNTTEPVIQTPSNQAKELISKHDAVQNVKAINTSDRLLIAIEIDHMKRFQLKKIEKELQKEMEKTFEDHKVELSSDKKIVLELEKLEEKIKSENVKEKTINKEIDRLIKLSREQT